MNSSFILHPSSFHLGLIGYPVSHSLSPKLHTAALKACGLEGDYALFPIAPDDMQGLKDLLERVRSGEITGLNVTIPHKQNVIPFMDELTPTARAFGAVSVIYLRDHKLIGDNADAHGFLTDLKKFVNKETGKQGNSNALVLGAGGSARAVVYVLLNDRWDVTITARRVEQAQEIAMQFGSVHVLELNFQTLRRGSGQAFQPFDKLRATLSNFQLIVNTTPIGMMPNTNQSPLPENLSLPDHVAIYDLVYNPRETKLVHDARAQGLKATTGLGMLIEQAALGFELWTGYKPPKDILYASVVE